MYYLILTLDFLSVLCWGMGLLILLKIMKQVKKDQIKIAAEPEPEDEDTVLSPQEAEVFRDNLKQNYIKTLNIILFFIVFGTLLRITSIILEALQK